MTGAGQGATCWIVSTRGMEDAATAEEAGHKLGKGEALVYKAADYSALLLEVEGLKAALDKYGRHFGWCASISSRNTAEGCSCGFAAALSPASGGV